MKTIALLIGLSFANCIYAEWQVTDANKQIVITFFNRREAIIYYNKQQQAGHKVELWHASHRVDDDAIEPVWIRYEAASPDEVKEVLQKGRRDNSLILAPTPPPKAYLRRRSSTI